ncbi:MAG: hypothetical protein ACXV8O_06835 [Methylobacter sp.]
MKYLLSLLVALFALTACGLPAVKETRYTMDTFEPTANVEVLQTWPRDRKYIEIAELEVSVGDQANNALLDKAREIGADAIVVGSVHRRGSVYVPIDGELLDGPAGSYRGITMDSVRAVALKFEP